MVQKIMEISPLESLKLLPGQPALEAVAGLLVDVGDSPNLGGDDHDYGDNLPLQLFTILDTFERYFFAFLRLSVFFLQTYQPSWR